MSKNSQQPNNEEQKSVRSQKSLNSQQNSVRSQEKSQQSQKNSDQQNNDPNQQNGDQSIKQKLYFQCQVHQKQSLYLCMKKDCVARSKICCDECIAAGPHFLHDNVKLSKVFTIFTQTAKDLYLLLKQGPAQQVQIQQQIKQSFEYCRNLINDWLKDMEERWVKNLNEYTVKHLPEQVKQVYGKLNLIPQIVQDPQYLNQVVADPDNYDLIVSVINNQQPIKQMINYPPHIALTYSQKLNPLMQSFDDFILKTLQPLEDIDLTLREQKYLNISKFQGKQLSSFFGHKSFILALCRLNDNNFASGSTDKLIKIWEVGKNDPIKQLIGHQNNIITLIKQTQDILISGGRDNAIIVWQWKEGIQVRSINAHNACVSCLMKLDQNRVISGSEDKRMRIWKWEDGVLLKSLDQAHNDFVNAVIQIDHDYIASGSKDKTIKLWNVQDWIVKKQINVEEKIICMLKISDDFVGVGTGNGKVRIYKHPTWESEFVLEGHSTANSIMQIILLDSETIATASGDSTIKIWLYKQKLCQKTLLNHTSYVFSLIQLNSETIISGGADNKIILWI